MLDAPDLDEAMDADALFARLKRWFTEDSDRQGNWRRKAREDFAFTSGDQLSEEDKARLREMNRPVIVMNRIEPVIDSVAGSEVANRQEVQFIPRTQGAVQVNEVLTYYSMLHRKPMGKYHIQVCTNISCMLRGAYDLYERFQDELGIGHKGVTKDGLFSLEEVECIGACCWAPAIQVNYDFHDDLTPQHVTGILETYRERENAERGTR